MGIKMEIKEIYYTADTEEERDAKYQLDIDNGYHIGTKCVWNGQPAIRYVWGENEGE
jgi:hypothetical protein